MEDITQKDKKSICNEINAKIYVKKSLIQRYDEEKRPKCHERKSIALSVHLAFYCQYAFCLSRQRYSLLGFRFDGRR